MSACTTTSASHLLACLSVDSPGVKSLAEIPDRFFRAALADVVPYEPGKPIEEVQRELGLDHVVKLASNEGPFGPLPAALDALAAAAPELNRYPDGGAFRLRIALADRFGLDMESVAIGSGADGIIGQLSTAAIDPGDEVVCGWPSFPSYLIDTKLRGGIPRLVPLRDGVFDLDAILSAIGPRTKIVYLCYPNNPTGTINSAADLDRYFAAAPDHVVTVLDQAYFEYVDAPGYVDGVARYLAEGRKVLVLRTFSKIYGLAGLRVGYGLGPPSLVRALNKARRPFDVTLAGQVAAVASLGPESQPEIARRLQICAEGRRRLAAILRENGFDPLPGVANFLYADAPCAAAALNDALLREGVIIRPMGAFGAPGAIRVTVGAPDELDFFAAALPRALERAAAAGP
jgi:histidinol-phosphate aminotransferase